jgi:succinyl-CoA synthetase beta subunit/citryl-CoA synthetase large subunit
VVVVVGRAGGMDVEEAAAQGVEFARTLVDPFIGLQSYKARELALQVASGPAVSQLAAAIAKLYNLYQRWDAGMAEINPLVLTGDGKVVAADCRVDIDEDALFRQREWLAGLGIPVRQERGREPTELERLAADIDTIDHRGVAGRVVEFDGDIALIIGGGGASLTVFDAILRFGGRPANYCEIGGNPTVRKVHELTKLLMSKPGVKSLAIVTNVLSNTRVDLVARGVIKGLLDRGIDTHKFPIVMRSSGSWEDEGYRILDKYGIKWFDRTHSMDEAATYIVDMRRQLEADDGHSN